MIALSLCLTHTNAHKSQNDARSLSFIYVNIHMDIFESLAHMNAVFVHSYINCYYHLYANVGICYAICHLIFWGISFCNITQLSHVCD